MHTNYTYTYTIFFLYEGLAEKLCGRKVTTVQEIVYNFEPCPSLSYAHA